MGLETFEVCLRLIRRRVRSLDAPVTRLKALGGGDPFRVAVGTILSARTRDQTLIGVLERLFQIVNAPQDILDLPSRRLQAMLRPIGFFRMKARALRRFAHTLIERHGGRVPDTIEELLELPGVGIKVAGIILVSGYGKKAISVDTHVHRIINRLGLLRTSSPEKTCGALYEILPRRLWPHINVNLVALGQTLCQPGRPRCDLCPIENLCPKVGVPRARVTRSPAPTHRRRG
jgi:endonuclease-3